MPVSVHFGGKTLAGRLFRAVVPPNPSSVKIAGVTRDSTGAALAGCTVDLIRTVNDVVANSKLSDAAGAYAFDVAPTDGPFYLVAYKAGAPDVAGTTVNTLMGQ